MKTVRFALSTATVYLLTIGVIGYALYPTPIFHTSQPVHAASASINVARTRPPAFTIITGKPVRLTVPEYGIDLPVDEGHYDESDGSWTLGDDHAYYALMTTPSNNFAGNTLIYGHGTDAVFGKLGARTPQPGTIAEVYTDNNHIFIYSFTDSRSVTPNDTSVLREAGGRATLTLQTCTGVFSEWRTMFRFEFKELVQ